MKTLLSLLLILSSFSMLACQGQQKETIREIIREPVQGSEQNHGGVDDGGGGNGVNGRPLESFAVRIQDIPAFNNLVLPIIRKVSETHPRFASDMVHIALNRTWYLVPVELNKLPAQVVGIGIADKDLQQLALQTLSHVWMNSNFFEKFPGGEEDRARLILHEIIMGVRLMKYQSMLDQCYSEIAGLRLDTAKNSEYRKLREACANKYGLALPDEPTIPGVGKRIELSKEDYDHVRELGVHFWNEKGETTKAELDAWLKDKNFRKY